MPPPRATFALLRDISATTAVSNRLALHRLTSILVNKTGERFHKIGALALDSTQIGIDGVYLNKCSRNVVAM